MHSLQILPQKNLGEKNMSHNLDDDGFTGLEAAIVLIAFVVVAAVFSYVVLGAGFFTTQKAQETVYKGIEQSTTNILIKGSVYGLTNDPASGIDNITFTLGLAPGASPIQCSNITIVYSTSSVVPTTYTYGGTNPSATQFYSSRVAMNSAEETQIRFITPVNATAGTVMNIEIRPPGGGAAIPFTKTVPATVTAVNVLR